MSGIIETSFGSPVTKQLVASPGKEVRDACKASLSCFGAETSIERPKCDPRFVA